MVIKINKGVDVHRRKEVQATEPGSTPKFRCQEDEEDLAKEPPRKVISQETTVWITQSSVSQWHRNIKEKNKKKNLLQTVLQ